MQHLNPNQPLDLNPNPSLASNSKADAILCNDVLEDDVFKQGIERINVEWTMQHTTIVCV